MNGLIEAAAASFTVSGDPEAARTAARDAENQAATCTDTARCLERLDLDATWHGAAAAQFAESIARLPQGLPISAGAHVAPAQALFAYASALESARAKAVQAAALWDEGQAETDRARAHYQAAVQRATRQAQEYAPGAGVRDGRSRLSLHL